MKAYAQVWSSPAPTKCGICNKSFTTEFVDGRLAANGSWDYMCIPCHTIYGVGLGIGRGQQYVKQPDDKWQKVEG